MNTRLVRAWLICAALIGAGFGVPGTLADDHDIEPQPPNPRLPVPPPSPPPDPGEFNFSANQDYDLTGSFWHLQNYGGLHTLSVSIRGNPLPGSEPNDPIDPNGDPPYNYPGKDIRPIDPNAPQAKNILLAMMFVVAIGPAGLPDPGAGPYLHTLDAAVTISGATLTTERGFEIPMSVTPITNLLTEVPTTLDLGQGTIEYDWDFAGAFSEMTGHYYLLRADVSIGALFIPEPATAAGTALLSAVLLCLRRRTT